MQRTWNLAEGLYFMSRWDEILEEHEHVARDQWTCSGTKLPAGWDPAYTDADGDGVKGIYLVEGGGAVMVRLNTAGGTAMVDAAADSAARASALVDRVKKELPKTEHGNEEIGATFWAYSGHGPVEYHRSLLAPSWDEISGNYSKGAREQIEWLTRDGFRPTGAGQLLLWHGPPGTGKTTAIRALMKEWKDWAKLHYIVDPDNFFGLHSDYMLRVMLDSDPDADQWKVLVLEDAGDLLSVEGQAETGTQALSRFLNAVDGMIGQGLRMLVIATTNEQIDNWHPAVKRAGRTLAQVKFPELQEHEVARWKQEHGLTDEGCDQSEAPAVLSDLYSELDEDRAPESCVSEKKVGF